MKKSNTIVIVGPTCSGKTTLAKALEQAGYERIITYTTRPMRENEVDGVDYHFLTEGEFERRISEGFFAEVTHYNASFGGCYYGSAKSDYMSKSKKKVVVLNPRGVQNLVIPRCVVVLLDLPRNILIDRAVERGDSEVEVQRRLEADDVDFKKLKSWLDTTKHTQVIFADERPIDFMCELLDTIDEF